MEKKKAFFSAKEMYDFSVGVSQRPRAARLWRESVATLII